MVTKAPQDYSVWKEAALVVSLLVNCVNLIGFVSTGWAVPLREHDPNFEGLGLWKYCSHNEESVVTCVNTKDLQLTCKYIYLHSQRWAVCVCGGLVGIFMKYISFMSRKLKTVSVKFKNLQKKK